MHATEREQAILKLLQQRGFLAFRDLERKVQASAATLRRDLERMAHKGHVRRVRGGVQLEPIAELGRANPGHLLGSPFHENIAQHRMEKELIGRAAAALCVHGEGIMLDGGSTTLQMCTHLNGLDLQILTSSIHIVSALLPQAGTRILMPGGVVFREQNIVLSPTGDDLIPAFHAPKLFMGGAAIGPQGVMQADVVLVLAEQRLIERAEQLILLVDSSKFRGPSGHVVCRLEDIDVVVTDRGIRDSDVRMLDKAGVRVVVAE